jgi:hypothetical protein
MVLLMAVSWFAKQATEFTLPLIMACLTPSLMEGKTPKSSAVTISFFMESRLCF